MHWYGAADPHFWYDSHTSSEHTLPAHVLVPLGGAASAHALMSHDAAHAAGSHETAEQPMRGPSSSRHR